MKQVMIDKLRKLRGCLWVSDKHLLVWNGDEDKGVLVGDQKHYFEINKKGEGLFRFPQRTPSSLMKTITWTMNELVVDNYLVPLNENLYGDVDERTSDQLRKVRV